MRAEQALDEMALLRMKLTQPFVRRVMDGWFSSFTGKVYERGRSVHLADAEMSRLARADAYFVSREMSQVIEFAAKGLDDSDMFVGDLWPCDTGFVWIDGGYQLHDHNDDNAVIKAMLWSRTIDNGVPTMFVTMYAALDDDRDAVTKWVRETYPDHLHEMGHVQLAHLGMIPDGATVGPPLLDSAVVDEHSFTLSHGDGSPVTGAADNHMRYILAMLMMFEQSITAKTQTTPDRASAKRWRRAMVPDRVTVIALRRTAHAHAGESEVEWHHRWVVRGHWRWQPYGTRSTACEHVLGSPVVENGKRVAFCVKEGCDRRVERIWIVPYIKGPDDAPFKVTDKINALVR